MVYSVFEVRVGCFIFNKNGKLLLLKNSRGTWGILGGHVETNEQSVTAVHRECMEEAQIRVKINNLFGVQTVKDSFMLYYSCKYVSGKINLQKEEVGDFAWVDLKDLKKYNLTFKEIPMLAKKAKNFV
jgi:NADH pyrophosphatase NudC (nudix superfamily)